ncbi:Macrolide export protein MacA [Paracoccus haematequi]|uniref:Macrolide export protein MacA n=1 Tax=Paracoccus haematequi TaxID=2491866 RepID=A0A447IKW5_9RHOB|nr:efflux RND transporter periplasmic adaptor subunit [Paracoccus haematequi]VDS08182.1 Macrolide export protein MacA [Paracoccus haematequi]
MRVRFRHGVLALAICAALAAGAAAVGIGQSGDSGATVLTTPVERGDIQVTVLAQGTLKPRNLVAVGAQASGRITRIAVELGQAVKKGDLIAQIDSVNQQNALKSAQSDLAVARAQRVERESTLDLAERTLDRLAKLQRSNLSLQAEYDTAVSDVAVSKAQIEALDAQIAQAQVAIETAQANLDYTRITAPSDGTVLAITAQQGQTVNAAQSAPTIVVLGDLTQMEVFAEISEADIGQVRPGQPVWFTILGAPERRYDAVLEALAPAPESIVNDSSIAGSAATGSSATSEAIYYNGRFTVPNPDGTLRTYMTAQVHIVLGSAQDVLTVPSMALGSPGPDGRYRLQVQGSDGTLSERVVSVGLNDKVMAEITEGLAEGEKIVTGTGGADGGSPARNPLGGMPRGMRG